MFIEIGINPVFSMVLYFCWYLLISPHRLILHSFVRYAAKTLLPYFLRQEGFDTRSCIKMEKRRLRASYFRHTASISLEIRQDSCGKFPCPAEKSARIRYFTNFQTVQQGAACAICRSLFAFKPSRTAPQTPECGKRSPR